MKSPGFKFFSVLAALLFVFQVSGQNNLKAVLVVGPQEDGTENAMKDMDQIADLFIKQKVTVYKFYDKDADWNEILKKAKDCNFFIYSGHGSNLGENGNVGGIIVNSHVSTSELIASLKLRPNSLVIFKSVCNGAGSSAGDTKDIGIAEAKKRVSSYSYPFFKIGASGYYANNYGGGVYNFLIDFFAGTTLKEAYQNSARTWTTVEFDEPFPGDPNKRYSIASSPGGGTSTVITYTNGVKKEEKIKNPKEYDIAYAGIPKFSIIDMK